MNEKKTFAFTYEPLPQESIRLLYLARGGTVSGELKTVPLSDLVGPRATQYDALSYHWGHAPVCEEIVLATREACNTTSATLPIAPTIMTALQKIRQMSDLQALWIDAICIYLDRSWTKCWSKFLITFA